MTLAVREPIVSLADLPPTPQQRGIVYAVAAVLFAAFGITAPFADTQLPPFVSFNPSVEAMIFVNDLVTSILLFSQYSINRSRAVLALAIGYFYAALVVIPHALTFPGAFTGLLAAAGPQTSAWLYYFWTAGTPMAVIAYALLSNADGTSSASEGSTRSAIGWSVALVIGLVVGITWITTAGHQLLPSLMSDDHYSNVVTHIINPLAILFAAIALALLWFRRRSVLDYWLLLVMLSLLLNYVIAAFLASQRYSLGFYASRGFTLVTSMLVLALLLREMTNLYIRLARSNRMLQRERNNKLMNLEAMAASISHEVRQPLTAVATNCEVALELLGDAPFEVRSVLDDIVSESHRAGQILDDIRSVFKNADQGREPIDMNEVAIGVLRTLRGELEEHGITTRVELTTELPHVPGHRGQLQEVILNLIHNAVEAMVTTEDRSRVLRVRTEGNDRDGILVAIEDSGPAISPEKLDGIFDPFVTTKSQGMGLGLAICRMIIERHGGKLSAWSSEKRSGALFQFTLPIKSEET
jgi:signal transduction histidine kinase